MEESSKHRGCEDVIIWTTLNPYVAKSPNQGTHTGQSSRAPEDKSIKKTCQIFRGLHIHLAPIHRLSEMPWSAQVEKMLLEGWTLLT